MSHNFILFAFTKNQYALVRGLFYFFYFVVDQTQKSTEVKKPTDLPINLNTPGTATPKVGSIRQKRGKTSEEKGPVSTKYFVYLFWALVLTRVWMNIWLLQLLVPLLALMWIFKAFGMY